MDCLKQFPESSLSPKTVDIHASLLGVRGVLGIDIAILIEIAIEKIICILQLKVLPSPVSRPPSFL